MLCRVCCYFSSRVLPGERLSPARLTPLRLCVRACEFILHRVAPMCSHVRVVTLWKICNIRHKRFAFECECSLMIARMRERDGHPGGAQSNAVSADVGRLEEFMDGLVQ